MVEENYGQLPKIAANIIINDLMKHCNEKKCKVNELGLLPTDISWLAGLIIFDVLDRTKVTTIIDYYIENGGEIKEIIDLLGLWPTYDTGVLEAMIDEVISNHPKAVEEILAGKAQAFGFLIGQLKKIDKNIDSKEAMELLKEKIK